MKNCCEEREREIEREIVVKREREKTLEIKVMFAKIIHTTRNEESQFG